MTKKNKIGEHSSASANEVEDWQKLRKHHMNLVANTDYNWNMHSLATLSRQSLSRILYWNQLYGKIIEVPGVIMEFGVHWGASINILTALRGIYEPYNYSRKIIGFDTFSGFLGVDITQDGKIAEDGDYSVSDDYEKALNDILDLQEKNAPLNHLKKFELIKGDAALEVNRYLEKNSQSVVAMAIFDMDIYAPTKKVLESIVPRLTRGSLIVFDELNCEKFPGETRAVDEVLGINNLKLRRDPNMPFCSWAVFGE
ncbi:MAG: hypothetical protein JXQ97_14620 [Natronospirillum sp.]